MFVSTHFFHSKSAEIKFFQAFNIFQLEGGKCLHQTMFSFLDTDCMCKGFSLCEPQAEGVGLSYTVVDCVGCFTANLTFSQLIAFCKFFPTSG